MYKCGPKSPPVSSQYDGDFIAHVANKAVDLTPTRIWYDSTIPFWHAALVGYPKSHQWLIVSEASKQWIIEASGIQVYIDGSLSMTQLLNYEQSDIS